MQFSEYQEKSRKTAKYPEAGNTFVYPTLGLVGEAGEVADKIKKHIRDDGITNPGQLADEHKQALAKELGDVLWYISQLCTECGLSLDAVAEMNINKLYSRMDRGKLSGSGDDR